MLLSQILPTVARMQPDRDAMKDRHGSYTYEQVLCYANSVAYGLRELGVKPGDRIVLLSDPSPSLAIAECAAIAIGAIPVGIFPGLARDEIVQIVRDADPIAIVYDSENAKISECVETLSIIHPIPVRSTQSRPSIASFISDSPQLTLWHQASPDDVALIIYTGGTTGRSKGVMHSHRGIASWSFLNPERGGGHNKTKKSLVPNQAHLTGQFILWTTLFEGGCLVYPDTYPLQAEEAVRLIEREQLKSIGTVGLLFKDIVRLLTQRDTPIPYVEGISCGGTPFGETTFKQAREVFPNAHLIEVYSQTESGQFISFVSINDCFALGTPDRILSVGNPKHTEYWGQRPFEVRIVDESGQDVEEGAFGEVICRGEQLMLGYWNNPEETSNALRNGWLHTGDIGQFDKDGFLYLLDRKKDIVIVGGSNVYGSEVEEALSTHPAIEEVAVIGTPLPDDGEEVTAVIVVKEHAELSLEELRVWCAGRLAVYKLPTRLAITDTLARTSVGKLNKAEIRKPYWQGRMRMIN
ncbi:class I adenylate-forming enzyme family protein [Cohnella sp. GCM10027633]|uniref:class I adenylate-forming enzyme family protein n=1 Tax=unclassified Cohnella TaxID=2636738 RepID=UPI0036350BE5